MPVCVRAAIDLTIDDDVDDEESSTRAETWKRTPAELTDLFFNQVDPKLLAPTELSLHHVFSFLHTSFAYPPVMFTSNLAQFETALKARLNVLLTASDVQ